MKKARKTVMLLTLCLVLMMSSVTMVGAEVTYDALDLSGTAVTVLDLTDASVDNNTTKIVVKGVTEGAVGDEITTGVTFTSSDQTVATVASDGTVTAVDEGATIITAAYGELSKSIVIVVGSAKLSYDYDTAPTSITTSLSGSSDTHSTDGSQGANYYYSWKNAQEIVTDSEETKVARTGTKALQINNILRAPYNNDATEYNTKQQIPSYNIWDLRKDTETITVDSVQSVWFYDDGTADKRTQIGFCADRTVDEDNVQIEARYSAGINLYSPEGYYGRCGDTFASNQIPRTKGWHQITSVGSSEGFTIYVDGQVFATIARTSGLKQGQLYCIREIPSGVEKDTTINHQIWLDDAYYVDTTKREPAVASFDLSKTENTVLCLTDEDTSNDTTQLKARGFRADGIEIENAVVEGLSYTSDNTAVATVSETGLVTAVNEGVAVITATNGTVSKNIVIAVGDTISDNTFNNTSDWTQETGVIDASNPRIGQGSLKLESNSETQTQTWILGGENPTKGSENGVTSEVTTVSLWFYDNGESDAGLFGTEGWASPRNKFFFCLSHYESKMDSYCSGYGVHNELTGIGGIKPVNYATPRTKGWHQYLATSYYIPTETGWKLCTTHYIDGVKITYGTSTTEGTNTTAQLFTGLYYKSGTLVKDGFIYVDDAVAVDVSDKKAAVTVTYDNTNGGVKVGEETVVSGEPLSVEYGEDLTLTFEPVSGYEAKVEGYTLTENQLTLENIAADIALNVTFEKLITEPSIAGNGEDGYLFKEANYADGKPAYVSYYKVIVPTGYTLKTKGYGMYLNGIQLIAEGISGDNMFGIRVYGEAINDTDSYEFKGFATLIKDGAETTVETAAAGSEDAKTGQE